MIRRIKITILLSLLALWISCDILTLQAEPKTFTITYTSNGATSGRIPDNQIKTEGADLTLAFNTNSLKNEGFTFNGWNTHADGSGAHYSEGEIYSNDNDLYLYAEWVELEVFTIRYDPNGADSGVAPSDQSKVSGKDIIILPNSGILLKENLIFSGWNTKEDGTGTSYPEGSNYSQDADIVLYAEWTIEPTYTVSYNANGALEGSSPETQMINIGDSVIIASNTGLLTLTGYSFDGWNTQANGSGINYSEGDICNFGKDIQLYAIWKINQYTITYDGNGNTNGDAPQSTENTYSSTVTVATKGTLFNTAFYFAGWNTHSDGNGISFAEGAIISMPASDITLYAQWSLSPIPDDVINLYSTPEDSGILLTWENPEEDNFSHVEISWISEDNESGTGTTTQNSYTVNGLTNGSKYLLTVSVVDTTGAQSQGLTILEVANNFTYITIGDIDFVPVNGGSFHMGYEDGEQDEQPVHEVTVSDFYISKFEVTQKIYEEIMGNNPSNTSHENNSLYIGDNIPVNNVNLNVELFNFCNALSRANGLEEVYTITPYAFVYYEITWDFSKNGFRLPTEAEWEFAARGGLQSQGFLYSGSNDHYQVGWLETDENHPNPVGLKLPNELGIYDMTGNFAEICWDGYSESYYSESMETNPIGIQFIGVGDRVHRGGYFGYGGFSSVFDRSYKHMRGSWSGLGIRLVIGTISDLTVPNEVANGSILEGFEELELSWTNPDDLDYNRTRITWVTHDGITETLETEEEYSLISGLQNNFDYDFLIQTIDDYHNISSGVIISGQPDGMPPGEVSDFEVDMVFRDVTLNWNPPEDEDFDYIELSWSIGGGDETTPISLNTTQYSLSNTDPNEEYIFTIRTVDVLGNTSEGISIIRDPVIYDSFDYSTIGDTQLVHVQGGEFMMGSDNTNFPNEQPVHRVIVSDFYLGTLEITHKNFMEFLNSLEITTIEKYSILYPYINGNLIINSGNEHTALEYSESFSFKGSRYTQDINTPIYNVTWFGALEFCNWLSRENGLQEVYTISEGNVVWNTSSNGFRLPTEAEWEYAARGGQRSLGYIYAGSDDRRDIAHTTFDSNMYALGGTKSPNELGIYDLTGNVAEICWDYFQPDYYESSVLENPLGPETGLYDEHVYRGGAMFSSSGYDTVTSRYGCDDYNNYYYYFGFRVAIGALTEDTDAPDEVSNLSTNVDHRKIQLSWTNPSDSDFKEIEITPYNWDGDVITTNEESIIIENLNNYFTYGFILRTVDQNGNKSSGEYIEATPLQPEVLQFTLETDDNSIKINWNNPDFSQFSHVEISWSPENGDAQPLTSYENSYSLTGLSSFTNYEVTIKTVDLSGNKSSGVSQSIHFIACIKLGGLSFTEIFSGTYEMGYGFFTNDRPVRTVTLDQFYISRYETTIAQFIEFMNEAGVSIEGIIDEKSVFGATNGNSNITHDGSNFVFLPSDTIPSSSYPVYGITWYGAASYCKWFSIKYGVSASLPTEAEWEYAARGGSISTQNYYYSGSNSVSLVGWVQGNSSGTIHPIGMKMPNDLILYDMTGNVTEWCLDWYDDTELYFYNSPQLNPQGPGPDTGTWKVIRGGGIYSDYPYERIDWRTKNSPIYGSSGFRIIYR